VLVFFRTHHKVGFAFLIVFVLAGFSTAHAQDKPNIIFITTDTLRADHLGCYGYPEQTSSHIDRLAGESILFADAITPIPITACSHTSIFSALYPAHNGSLDNSQVVDEKNKLLAEILRDNGYRTAAFVSSIVVNKQTGLNRGFEFFDDPFPGSERRAGPTIRQTEKWVKTHGDAPFFIWIHLYDAHSPYSPPARYVRNIPINIKMWKKINARMGRMCNLSNEERSTLIALYDGEIRYMDRQLGYFLELLKKENLYQQSVIVLMGDHGEILGEKENYYGHHRFVYEPSIRIPLIIKLPKVLPQLVPQMTRSIDVIPTLLSYLKIDSRNPWDGRNLWPAIQKKRDDSFPKFCYIETPPLPVFHYNVLFPASSRFSNALISASRHFFSAPIPEFSHLFSALISASGHFFSTRTSPNHFWNALIFVSNPFLGTATRRSDVLGVRTQDWKYWHNRNTGRFEECLFYLKTDPGETLNLIAKNPGKARQLKSLLCSYENTETSLIGSKNFEQPNAANEFEEKKHREKILRLKSLGYL